MKKLASIIIASLFIILTSCEKEETGRTSSANIYGKWKTESGDDNLVYLIITNDNLFYRLRKDVNGFRNIESGVVQIIESQINFSGEGLYNYTYTNNELTITNIAKTIVFSRDTEAPEKDEWMQIVAPLQSFAAPIQTATDITFDGQFLWYGNAYASNHIYKINRTNLTVQQTIPVTQSAWGIVWADGNLWLSHNGFSNIHKINPANGSTITSSLNMGAWVSGIAWDGQHLWCASINERTIYKYNPATNIVESQFPINVGIPGMCYANGVFYLCVNGRVHKCTMSPFEVLSTYSIDNEYIEGITYDGSHFWVVARNSTQTPSIRILRVNLP